jgi:hypothetical protein
MKRKTLLKTLGISAIGLATIPLWMNSWNAEELPEDDGFLTGEQRLQLQEIVDTIIPKTDTPGAKELGVEKFISLMVKDCYNEEVKAEFLTGFREINLASEEIYGNPFIEITDAERNDVLCTMETIEIVPGQEINFVAFVKVIAIAGYRSSQYVLENHTDYELIPSRFHGSFPVSQSIYTNAK